MTTVIVASDLKTLTAFNSLRQICDRVVATLEKRPGYPAELQLTPRQALMLMIDQMQIIRRILKMPSEIMRKVS